MEKYSQPPVHLPPRIYWVPFGLSLDTEKLMSILGKISACYDFRLWFWASQRLRMQSTESEL